MVQVTAVVIVKEGKILIARRRKGICLAHKWEFPGCKLEPHETMVQCLKRELKEKFGIDVEIDNFICMSTYRYDYGQVELFAYTGNLLSGDFILTDHDEIKWVLPSELIKFDFAEADLPICKRLVEGI